MQAMIRAVRSSGRGFESAYLWARIERNEEIMPEFRQEAVSVDIYPVMPDVIHSLVTNSHYLVL